MEWSTPSRHPAQRTEIWAGSDTGLIHLTRDGGKTLDQRHSGRPLRLEQDHTHRGVPLYSLARLMRRWIVTASTICGRISTALAISAKPGSPLSRASPECLLERIREDPKRKGLLFAGTEFGVYVSFNDGDHWLRLQLNLPITSVRDLVHSWRRSGDRHARPLILGTG